MRRGLEDLHRVRRPQGDRHASIGQHQNLLGATFESGGGDFLVGVDVDGVESRLVGIGHIGNDPPGSRGRPGGSARSRERDGRAGLDLSEPFGAGSRVISPAAGGRGDRRAGGRHR